ncbi:hypothetical protein BGZ95_002974 [Linnemannia exigua]|uniref:CID domain-containing protein n=1 Tax=Linnemannia exigua TaxID=604196 RepID=A0AAD4H3Z9_9FUNG|nr:hypothetical protein BGZ95_002974 [Linnemannia exigua]
MSANKESGGASKDPPPEVTEFQKELHGLFDHSRTASASKIERLTKLAFKAARYYKNIVYCLEKFITRCVPEYKLTGLYVLDAICRTSQSAKTKQGSSGGGSFTGSEYVARFEKNIEALFVEFTKVVEDKEKEKVKRVVEIWERSGTFATKTTDSIKKKYFPLLETEISRAAAAAEKDAEAVALAEAEAAKEAQESSADKAASFITSLAASLAASNSPVASAVSPNTSNPSPPPTAAGSTYMPSLHYPLGNTYSTTTSSTPVNTATNPLLGISDPSSALALQTLLATVSQVKAAAAEVGAAAPAPAPVPAMPPVPGLYPGYAGTSSMTMPDYGSTVQGTSSSPLPLVLQQLQGMLSNSNQQNLGFGLNNNSVVSNNSNSNSTVPSSTTPPSTSSTGVSSSVMSVMSGAIDPRTRGLAMTSLPHGFPGGSAPGGGMPRDPRSVGPTDPRTQQQQQLQGMAPTDPRADPRLMMQQGRPGPGGVRMSAQPLSGTAQPPYQQAQSLFQGAHAAAGVPPLHLGSLLDGQNGGVGGGAMLMRNAAAGGVDVGALGMHKVGGGGGAGLDAHAMAQLASFMNGSGVTSGGSLPYQQAGRGENGKGAQPSGSPFPYSGVVGGNSSIHSNGGQSRQGVNGSVQDGYPRRVGGGEHMNDGRGGSMEEKGNSNRYGVKEDPSIGPDQIRVISRTLWVAGSFIPSISEKDLEAIFSPLGKIATLMVNQTKFNAFIKMTDRLDAERCKAELGGTLVHGETMKVGWGCGFGPRDCFDYTTGTGVIPLERLTETDRRWLANSVVGGFGPGEGIRGGVSVVEPNIEPVGRDGREALPRRGGLVGSGGGGGGGGGGGSTGGHIGGVGVGRGRGRGRGRGEMMDSNSDDFGVGRGRGRGGIHSLPPPPPPSLSMANTQHQQQPFMQPKTHPLPHRPQVSAVGGAAVVKRDLVTGLSQHRTPPYTLSTTIALSLEP